MFLSGAVFGGGVFPAVECFFPVLFPVQIWFSSEVGKHLLSFQHGSLMGGVCWWGWRWRSCVFFAPVGESSGGVLVGLLSPCSWRSTSVGVFLFSVYGGWSLETKVVMWRLVMSLLFRGEVIVMVFGV
jgi:hypothetical protein